MVRPNRIAGGLEMKSCFVLSIIFFSFVIQKILCIYPYVGGPIFVSIRDQIFIFYYPKNTSMYTVAHFMAEFIIMPDKTLKGQQCL